MRAPYPPGTEERRLRARLVEHCQTRHLAFKVAQCTSSAWRGVVFSLLDVRFVFASAGTRAALLSNLRDLVDDIWPLHRGGNASHANRAAKKLRPEAEQARAVAS